MILQLYVDYKFLVHASQTSVHFSCIIGSASPDNIRSLSPDSISAAVRSSLRFILSFSLSEKLVLLCRERCGVLGDGVEV
ncbi:hypothetical protein Hanom_Chr03g00178541 [Helianthus anomalus]